MAVDQESRKGRAGFAPLGPTLMGDFDQRARTPRGILRVLRSGAIGLGVLDARRTQGN